MHVGCGFSVFKRYQSYQTHFFFACYSMQGPKFKKKLEKICQEFYFLTEKKIATISFENIVQ